MTKQTYLDMMEQMGREPDPDKMPPDMEDFPSIVQEAINVFNTLGDRIVADVGYLGKDYTLLPVFLESIDDRELFIEIITWLDAKLIKRSADEMKKARDKVTKKPGLP